MGVKAGLQDIAWHPPAVEGAGDYGARLARAHARVVRRAMVSARRKKRRYLRTVNGPIPLKVIQDWLSYTSRRDAAMRTLVAFGALLYFFAIASGTVLYMLSRAA